MNNLAFKLLPPWLANRWSNIEHRVDQRLRSQR